jgi:hypothetical protein
MIVSNGHEIKPSFSHCEALRNQLKGELEKEREEKSVRKDVRILIITFIGFNLMF